MPWPNVGTAETSAHRTFCWFNCQMPLRDFGAFKILPVHLHLDSSKLLSPNPPQHSIPSSSEHSIFMQPLSTFDISAYCPNLELNDEREWSEVLQTLPQTSTLVLMNVPVVHSTCGGTISEQLKYLFRHCGKVSQMLLSTNNFHSDRLGGMTSAPKARNKKLMTLLVPLGSIVCLVFEQEVAVVKCFSMSKRERKWMCADEDLRSSEQADDRLHLLVFLNAYVGLCRVEAVVCGSQAGYWWIGNGMRFIHGIVRSSTREKSFYLDSLTVLCSSCKWKSLNQKSPVMTVGSTWKGKERETTTPFQCPPHSPLSNQNSIALIPIFIDSKLKNPKWTVRHLFSILIWCAVELSTLKWKFFADKQRMSAMKSNRRFKPI